MPYLDLDAAERQYHALRELIIHHPGGWRDESSLQRLRKICRAANAAVEDLECREHIGAVEDYACGLYSETGHRKWALGNMSGADLLRLRILRELSSFQGRLAFLEASQQAQRGTLFSPTKDRPPDR